MTADVAIIGAGPAALAAADVLAPYSLRLVLVDEQISPGGQIYRQPPRELATGDWRPEKIYSKGRALIARVSGHKGFEWKLGTTALGIVENHGRESSAISGRYSVLLEAPDGAERLSADLVLLATGCYDMPMTFPGASLPGVMAAGGIQIFIKTRQIVPGHRFVFFGTHPLQLIVADQVIRAGGDVVEVIFPQTHSQLLRACVSPGLLAGPFGNLTYFAGVLARLVSKGVRIRFGETVVRALGKAQLEAVAIAQVNSPDGPDSRVVREIPCDRLGVCLGFLAATELARQVGARPRWCGAGGGWVICHDEWMQTDRAGIFVAGEVTGIGGADMALQQGRLAALGMLRARGLLDEGRASSAASRIRRRLRRLERFARVLRRVSDPTTLHSEACPPPDSILCKCEDITVGEFLEFLRANPAVTTAKSAKLGCRVGMGLCQGRYCHYAVTRLMGRILARPESAIGPFTAQWPVKPVRIATLIKAQWDD